MEMFERLRLARQSAGFGSANDAAQALGVPYPTYAAHENGTTGFKLESGEKYARRFKVKFEWLMLGTGPMTDLETKHQKILTDFDRLPAELQDSYANILRILVDSHKSPQPDQDQQVAGGKLI